MRNRPLIALLIPTALLASCVSPSEQARHPSGSPATPAVAPQQLPASPAPSNAEWQYRTATPGDWTYRTEGTGSVARFGPANGPALVTLTCDTTTHRISVARAGVGNGPITIRTSYGAVNWPASSTVGASSQTIALRAANDSALDQIAYSRGRFAIEVQGLPVLILPVWAEIARVIEDCRG